MRTLLFSRIDTPIGEFTLFKTERGLSKIAFPEDNISRELEIAEPDDQSFSLEHTQFAEYFAGTRRGFELELDLPSAASFRGLAQRGLALIPYGETVSYGELAAMLNNPRAARAVGTACATNPLPLVLPCHRVLAAGGKLGGYGGELWRKEYLLELEQG